jgi:hypothetical protein
MKTQQVIEHERLGNFPIKGVTKTETTSLHVAFGELRGYVIYTISDALCLLQIDSDYSSWAYRWNQRGLGNSTFREFLSMADNHYLAEKLFYGNSDKKHEFDCAATIRKIKEQLIADRKEGALSAEKARSLWDDLNDLSDCSNDHEFHHECSVELQNHFYEIWEYFQHKPTVDYLVLYEVFLPLLKNLLAEAPE